MRKFMVFFVAALTLFALTGAIAFAHDAEVSLTAQNGSGQNGSAELTDMGDGTTKVVVDISSTTTDPQPAHIHTGTCSDLNPKPAYPLSNVVNGHSETIVPVTAKELLASAYAINVHKSAAEVSVYVSCGSIMAAMDEHGTTTAPGMPTTGSGDQNFIFTALAIIALSMTTLGLKLSRRKI
ncbi:MAG: hypothetical protein ABI670_01430 [Chloroflexota bacterium]